MLFKNLGFLAWAIIATGSVVPVANVTDVENSNSASTMPGLFKRGKAWEIRCDKAFKISETQSGISGNLYCCSGDDVEQLSRNPMWFDNTLCYGVGSAPSKEVAIASKCPYTDPKQDQQKWEDQWACCQNRWNWPTWWWRFSCQHTPKPPQT